MLRKSVAASLLLILAAFPAWSLAVEVKPSLEEVASNLVCPCGCENMMVSSCECGSAVAIRAEIGRFLDQGLSKELIWDYYAEQYGRTMIATPPTEGFSLTVWVLPFFSVIVVGTALSVALRRWTRRVTAEPEAVAVTDSSDEQLLEQLSRELKEFYG